MNIILDGREIKPGERTRVNLNIARLPTHTMIDLPVFVYRAQEPGPVLLLTAGLHGDEINGIEAIRRMIHQHTIEPERGTVIAIPVVNVYGFIHLSRKLPDGKDLNRSFPGSSSGSLAGYIANVLMTTILPYIDAGVDFHTGGASKMNYPHLRCNLDTLRNEELARAFAPPFIVNSRAPDHSFRKSAALAGKTILTFEAGESLRLDELAINEGINGIYRLMQYLGMHSNAPEAVAGHILRGSWWNRAVHSGIFHATVKMGAAIEKNQILGHIRDPFGDKSYRVRASKSGYVIGINHMCVVHKGEALIHIGSE